jgi:N-acetylneuraminate lyase
MKFEKLEGLIAAPFTPMDEKGDLCIAGIESFANHLIKSKVTGAFVCGTTGEGFSLKTEEREAVLENWVKYSRGKLKIICHVGSNCLSESKDLAAHAEKYGAYAIGCISPSFFKPGSAKELIDYLAPVAMAAPDLPFYYYNMPSMTGVNIQVSELFSLAKERIPNFAGVKFTHSDLYDMQKCIAFDNGRFEVLNGFDEILLCGITLGVSAAVGSTYNFMPSVYLELWDAYREGDINRARELQQFSVRVVDKLVKYKGAILAGKAIMGFLGVECGPCRVPLRTLSDEEKQSLKRELDEIGFFRKA